MTARKLLSFCVPGGLLFFAAVVLIKWNLIDPWLGTIVQIGPGAILITSVLLGWRFNRSRLVFAVLMLAIADRVFLYFAPGANALGKLILISTAILLPLNLAILSLVKERGIATPHGIFRVCLILAQPLAVAATWRYHYDTVSVYLDYPIIKASILQSLPPMPLPQSAMIAMVIAFLLLGCGLIRRQGPIESGFFWALATVCFTLVSRKPGTVSTFYFCTAGLILLISVVEASYAMAFRDELTGLPARRSLNEFLYRMGSHYTVAMVDIDFFKKVNDTYGHEVGDQVLCMVASKLAKVSGGGKAFRYGGEEFTVIFPGKAMEETIPFLEHLRIVIESAAFQIRGRARPKKKPKTPAPGKGSRNSVPVTISIGVAERDEENVKPRDVIKAADQALYRAKKEGRNRVCT
ncbi:MAG: GGDEF domain-containing protein [Syntrophobacter sp.]